MRSRSLFLPILLSLPLTLAAQQTKELSPALRAKLMAQNTVPPPAGPPAVPAAVGDPDPLPPAGTPAVPATATPGSVNPAPATPGSVTPAPATPGTPPTTVPPTPPRVPRPAIPLPGRTTTPRSTPLPGTVNGAALPASTTPGATDAVASDENIEEWGEIAFIDADINEVVQKYMAITGRHVLKPADLQGKVNLVSNLKSPFKSMDEAAEFIKAGLALQNFTIQKYNETTDKILMLTSPPLIQGLKGGEPIYTREEDLPDEDVVVNFVLSLKHLTAVDAVNVLSTAVPVRQFTKYIAVPTANAIFIQEYTSNIRTLLRVTKSLDLPPIKMIHEWVELERASAEDVQAILDQILQAQSQGRSSGGGQSGPRSISPAAAAANLAQPGAPAVPVTTQGGGASSGLMPDGSQVIVKADPRTNRVFLNGPEEHIKFLKTLIREFDEPSRVKNLLTQQLRYIPVNDFFGLATKALEATGAGQAGGGGGGGGAGSTSASRTGGRSNTGDFGGGNTGGDFRSNFSSRSSGSQLGGTSGFGGTGGSGRSSTRSGIGGGGGGGATQLEAPLAETVGKTLLISDPRTNSLIVSGPPDSIQRVSDLVKEMDRRPYQVHINAVIAQVAIGDDMTSAVDILRQQETINVGGEIINTAGFFRSGAGSFVDPSVILPGNASLPAATGLNLFAASTDLFNAYVRLLEVSNKSKLLAKPHITVANNQRGSISSGERLPIPANQQTAVVGGATNSVNTSIEYENVVLSLDVTPLINSRNEITLQVDQLNDTVNGTTDINGDQIPNIATQELSTNITIPNGAILVLGGLLSEQERKTNSGVPIISKIPVLKYLVGANNRNKQRRELLVLLQARIIENADDIMDVNVTEIQRAVVGPDAEAFAKPERNTDNVRLPTFEQDVPFNGAALPEAVSRPRSKSRK